MERVSSIFSQIVRLVPRRLFDDAVTRHQGEKHAKGMTCWSQFVSREFCHRCYLDIDAKDAIDAPIRHYHAEEEHRTLPKRALGDRAERVSATVMEMCEWRLGRDGNDGAETASGLPVADLINLDPAVGFGMAQPK